MFQRKKCLPDYIKECNIIEHIKMQGKHHITKKLIHRLEKSTGMLFVDHPTNSSVCFANQNSDLRDEYKDIFTQDDIVNFLKSCPETDTPDSTTFWQQVAIGKQFKITFNEKK